MDTNNVKLTDGCFCYWKVDEPMPAKLKVYRGSWKSRECIGWCTRQHAIYSYNRGTYYSVNLRGHSTDIRLAGDVGVFHGDAA